MLCLNGQRFQVSDHRGSNLGNAQMAAHYVPQRRVPCLVVSCLLPRHFPLDLARLLCYKQHTSCTRCSRQDILCHRHLRLPTRPGPFPFRSRLGSRPHPRSKHIYSLYSRTSPRSTHALKLWRPDSIRTPPRPTGPRHRIIRTKSLAIARRLLRLVKQVGNWDMLDTARCCCHRQRCTISGRRGVRVAIRPLPRPGLTIRTK